MKKKIICIISLIVAVSLAVCGTIVLINNKKFDAFIPDLPDGFTYTAHTGCMGTKDNSLESIDEAIKYGADIVEFDLYFTADGEPVLSHDEPKGGEITLDEAFERVSRYNGLRVNVDVKTTDALDKVMPLAEKHGISELIFYTGIEESDVEAVLSDSPEVPYYLNVDVKTELNQSEEYIQMLVKKVKECGAVGINFSKKNATKKIVDAFHENGLLVSIWTVNDKGEICDILALSPDNITTRRPDRLQEIVAR